MINDDLSIKSKRQSSSETSSTGRAQRTKKDFQEVLAKEENEENKHQKSDSTKNAPLTKKGESFEEISQLLAPEESSTQKKGVSLFDLARKTPEELEASQPVSSDMEQDLSLDLPEDIKENSLQALFHEYGLRGKLELLHKELNPDSLNKPFGFQKDVEDSVLKFSKTPLDLAALPTPVVMPPEIQSTVVQPSSYTNSRILELKEIIDQIVDKLYTIESKGKTDLVIKLSHPPLLAGSTIVITAFSTARGEFNITFENLSLAAQKILGAVENQNSLKSALEEKGFIAHIITATTLKETTDPVEDRQSETPKGRPGYDEQPPDKRQNKKRDPDRF